MKRSRLQLEEAPPNYIRRAVLAIASTGTIFLYFAEVPIPQAQLLGIDLAQNASGDIYLAKIREPDRQAETLDIDDKLAKSYQVYRDFCIKPIVKNGLMPFLINRKIVRIEPANCE